MSDIDLIITSESNITLDVKDAGPAGAGVPTGGTTDQVLAKASATDYDYAWQTPAGGGDMSASTYDPTAVAGDAFAMDNMVEGTDTKILTAAERTKLTNTSGTNTGDQDISAFETTTQLNTRDTNNRNTDNHTNGTTNKVFTATEQTKLTGIESNATADQTAGEIKTAYESNADTNAFTDSEQTKLTGVETGATANQTDAHLLARGNHTGTQTASTISDFDTEVSNNTSVSSNTAKRTYPSGDETKLAEIEAGATANDTDANLKNRANHTGSQAISTVTNLQSNLDSKADSSSLSTVATSGSYTDLSNKPDLTALEEVLVFTNLAGFPATGEAEKVYIAEDTGYMYRWDGTGYTQLTDQTAIWGNVSGTLSNQTDLNNALNTKLESSDISDFETSTELNARDTANRSRTNHTGTQTASTISDFDTAVSANSDVTTNTAKNSYPSADATKLAGIETGAEVNQSNTEIKTQYEANADTNAFTDAEKTKLTEIEAGAEVNAVDSVAGKTGAVSLVKTDVGLANVTNDAQLKIASNLSDVANTGTARTNLGVESTTQLNTRDTNNRARANHTGTQALSTISDAGTAASKNIHVGTTAPGSPSTGDLWVDTT